MSTYVQRFTENTKGKDYVVGDIHGCFSKLEAHLRQIGFNPETDRLFAVGDLVDRGPESEKALEWLSYNWFHSVRGNHDDFVIRYRTIDTDNWIHNGGLWFQYLLDHEKQALCDAFSVLPYAIEVETPNGLVGIVHADPIISDWSRMEEFLQKRRSNRTGVLWSRKRASTINTSTIRNVKGVFVGHTPSRYPYRLGNVYHVDTYGWRPKGNFTVVNITSKTKREKLMKTKRLTKRQKKALRGPNFAATRSITQGQTYELGGKKYCGRPAVIVYNEFGNVLNYFKGLPFVRKS